jgi:hypothetical protein
VSSHSSPRLAGAVRISLLLGIVMLAMPSLAQSQQDPASSCLSRVFGPEVFVRLSGEPVTASRTLEVSGFTPPFVLHVRNGRADRTGRTSSAEVRLNGDVILSPSSFSQQVNGYDVPVVLSQPSRLDVRMASAPGSMLTVWISGRATEGSPLDELTLDPAGGRYVFPSGIILDVPPGAVSAPTDVGACLSEAFLVDPLLESYGQVPKYLAAGFEGAPDGLSFDVPIKVTLPVRSARDSGDVPLLLAVDIERGVYSIADGILAYDPAASTATFALQHFSGWAVAFGNDIKSKVDCRARETRCMCGAILVTEVVTEDQVAGQCFESVVTGSVEFLECPGSPLQQWSIREWERGIVSISPPGQLELLQGQSTTLSAAVTNAQGSELPNATFTWETDDPQVVAIEATTNSTASIRGLQADRMANVYANAGCGAYNFVTVKVRPRADCPPCTLAISGPAALQLGTTATYRATVVNTDTNETVHPELVWAAIPGSGAVQVAPGASSEEVQVTGTGCGSVVLQSFVLEDPDTTGTKRITIWELYCVMAVALLPHLPVPVPLAGGLAVAMLAGLVGAAIMEFPGRPRRRR